MQTDSTVSRQWATRPSDQRFLSLQELHDYTLARADKTQTFNHDVRYLKAYGSDPEGKDLGELVINTNHGPKTFTNWSFNQISQNAGAPASYLRKLPAPLAALNLNYGFNGAENQVMLQSFDEELRCSTSTTYGRIWDHDVVSKVREVTAGSSWQIPASTYSQNDPRRATTLYASDRDVFIFLVDPHHPIEIPGQQAPSFRGFYVWNSEVGSQTFGLAAFLYETVCDNRIIWGISNKQELRIRHSSGAPERFLQEGRKTLIEYANESTQGLIEKVQRAQRLKVGDDEDEVRSFLQKRGLSLAVAKTTIERAKEEENEFNTPWSLAQGLTAYARSIQHTDTRVDLERKAGAILDYTTR